MPSHRIKLVLSEHLRRSSIPDGGGTSSCWSKVVDVAPETWTLEKLLKLVVRDFWKDNKEVDVNNITLSLAEGNKTIVDWKSNPKALVRDVIPKQSSVHCGLEKEVEKSVTIDTSSVSSSGNDSKEKSNDNNHKETNVHVKPAPAEVRPSKKSKKASSSADEEEDVIVLMSDEENESNDGANINQQKIKTEAATAKRQTNTKTASGSSTLDDPRDPTTVTTMDHWIYQQGPNRFRQEEVLGKWLVFRNSEAIADTWKIIATAVQSGELKAVSAKVATHYNNNMSSMSNNNPFAKKKKKQQSYVICVYTSQARIDQVGRLLIAMVQHDIRYKTDEMTLNGVYANTSGTGKASMKTLYWNHGHPDNKRKLWTMTESLKRARNCKAAKQTDESAFRSFDKVQVTVKALQHHYYQTKSKSGQRRPDVINQPVQLERERTNTYDKNAIYVVLLGGSSASGGNSKLGYLAKDHAAILAPWMDRNLIQLDGSTVVSVTSNRESATLELKGRAHPQAQEMWQCFA